MKAIITIVFCVGGSKDTTVLQLLAIICQGATGSYRT